MPKKPKKVDKVKRSKEWKRRSKAAKKGWKARKLKESILDTRRKLPAILKKLPKSKRKNILPRAKSLPGLNVQVDERIKELEQRIKDLEYYATFVSDNAGPEWVKDDGTVALNPSTLRVWGRDVRLDLWARIENARENGHLDEEALSIAAEYQIPVREVYSFFMSP